MDLNFLAYVELFLWREFRGDMIAMHSYVYRKYQVCNCKYETESLEVVPFLI